MTRLRLLLVEDNPGDAGLVKVTAGHPPFPPSFVHVVATMREALKAVDATPFDAALLDLALPDAAGVEAVELLRLYAPNLPIVVLTGNDDQDLGLRAIEKGAQGFLVKGMLGRQGLAFAVRQAIQQKRAETALQESVERTQALLDNMEEMFFSVDVAGSRPPLVAKAAERIFGLPLEHFRRNPWLWHGLVHPDDEGVLLHLENCVAAGHPGQAELRIVRPDGEVRWIECSLRTFCDARRRPLQVEGVVRDVTTRKAAAEQARRLLALEEQDRFRIAFLNAAAHELGTPLTPVRIEVATLLRDGLGPLAPGQRASLTRLQRNIERLGRLVEDLLDASRLHSGRLKLVPRRIDVAALLEESVAVFRGQADAAGVTISTQAERGTETMADDVRLGQVLTNLLHNALKFTPRGGRVHVALARVGDACEVRVQDSGVGLTREQMAQLFKPFSQVHDGATGSGLGLFISQGIANQHGGEVRCDSAGPGKGCTFTLRVPIQPVPQPEGIEALAMAEGAPAASPP